MHVQKINRLKRGNSKLRNMLVFDLPAGEACPNSADCIKTCYSMKAQRQYRKVREWRADNFSLAKDDLCKLEQLIRDQLERTGKKVVRIHSSGDFFSQEYVDLWARVIRDYPEIRFYSYTKVRTLDFFEIESLPNFNLIRSYVDGKLNYGDRAYVKSLGVFVCPATTTKTVKCNAGCNYCLTGKNVAFVKH